MQVLTDKLKMYLPNGMPKMDLWRSAVPSRPRATSNRQRCRTAHEREARRHPAQRHWSVRTRRLAREADRRPAVRPRPRRMRRCCPTRPSVGCCWWRARPSSHDGRRARWSAAPQLPTLYLHGADDGCMTAAFTPLVRPVLPAGSDIGVIERAGHFLQLDQPDEVGRRIVEFLS